jgi:hypothetical protein
MKAISLKLPEELEEASRRCAASLRLSRAAYIRLAVERMNREMQTRERARRLAEVSRKVRSESMHVNKEFSAIERDPDA